MKIGTLLFTVLGLVGCLSVTPLREDAKLISITQRAADVASCKLIQETSIDRVIDYRYQPTEATQSLRNLAMNKAAELGGNTVLMGSEQQHTIPVTSVSADIKVFQCASAAAGGYPENYQQLIKTYMEERLFDSVSAIYKDFSKPSLTTMDQLGGRSGYLVTVKINAKNRLGGYVGFTCHRYFIENGKVTYTDELENLSRCDI